LARFSLDALFFTHVEDSNVLDINFSGGTFIIDAIGSVTLDYKANAEYEINPNTSTINGLIVNFGGITNLRTVNSTDLPPETSLTLM